MPKVVHTNEKGLIQQAGSGVDFQSGLAVGAQSIAAAGANQATATEISAFAGATVLVTGADDTKGVKLPALSTVPAGQLFMIVNVAANTLEVYPAVDDEIYPAGDNTAITVAASSMLICIKADSDKWVGAEPAVVSA